MIPMLSHANAAPVDLSAVLQPQKRVSLPAIPNTKRAIELALIPWLFREVAWNIQRGLEKEGAHGEWQHQSSEILVKTFQFIADEPTLGYDVPDSYNKRINRCLDICILPFQDRFATGVFAVKSMLDLLVDDKCLNPIPVGSDFEKAFILLCEVMTSTDVDNGYVNNDKIWAAANKQARKLIKELRRVENLYVLPAGTPSVCD